MDNNKSIIPLKEAVEAIKTTIMQGQYEALKDIEDILVVGTTELAE